MIETETEQTNNKQKIWKREYCLNGWASHLIAKFKFIRGRKNCVRFFNDRLRKTNRITEGQRYLLQFMYWISPSHPQKEENFGIHNIILKRIELMKIIYGNYLKKCICMHMLWCTMNIRILFNIFFNEMVVCKHRFQNNESNWTLFTILHINYHFLKIHFLSPIQCLYSTKINL